MAWLLLVVAGLFEIGWAIGLKYTDGFTRLWPSVWTGLAMVASVVLLALAVRTLPIGTAYAVWTGSAPRAPLFSGSTSSASLRPRCALPASRSSSRGS
jgi:multidrug transporter EmrE-like cation transporter